jgi:hypothetical protein
VQQIIEKRSEFNLQTYIAFIDFDKAFDKIDRNKLWNILYKSSYPTHLTQTMKCLYNIIHTDISGKISEEISTNQGEKQGRSLSPTLSNTYIDDMLRTWKAMTNTRTQVSNTFISTPHFADDQIIRPQ